MPSFYRAILPESARSGCDEIIMTFHSDFFSVAIMFIAESETDFV